MRNRYGRRRMLASVTVGWLFADLLLALAMLFLTANTITVVNRPPTPTPTPTLTPTPTPPLRLETKSQRLVITIDPTGVLADSPGAVNSVKQQLHAQRTLQGRDVGIAIVYDGAPTDGDIPTAQTIDAKIYRILGQLGQEKFAFSRASFYDDLFVLNSDPSRVAIDVYLFNQT